jgi:hypothetical protein
LTALDRLCKFTSVVADHGHAFIARHTAPTESPASSRSPAARIDEGSRPAPHRERSVQPSSPCCMGSKIFDASLTSGSA